MTETTAERVCKIVMDHLPNATVLTMLTPLDKLGIDSLDRWDMVIKIEEEFGIDIEQEAITAWNTVQDVIDTVDNLYRPHLTALDRAAEHQAEVDVLTIRTPYTAPDAVSDPRIAEIAMLLRQMDDYKIARPTGALDPTFSNIAEIYVPEDRNMLIKILREKINAHVDYLIRTGQKIASSKTYGQIDTPVINRITRQDVENFAIECKIDQRDCMMTNIMNEYQRIATKSAIYPGQGTPLGLAYVALKLNGEAGEFAEHVGKAMRDDKLMTVQEMYYAQSEAPNCIDLDEGKLTPERRAAIIKEIGDVLWYASAACNELGITLSEAALTNLEKLCDRTERDALRGSGDDR